MSLLSLILPNGVSGFGYGTTATQVLANNDLTGKTILVTGCNSGLGLETIRVLIASGCSVVGTARTVEKATEALTSVGADMNKNFGVACELSDSASCRSAVAAVLKAGHKLDAIIANAGIMALPKHEKSNNIELQLFTNHFGHFILVTGLLPALTPKGRVVMLSSAAHAMAPTGCIEFDNLSGDRGYSAWKHYGQSKIANLLFAKELSRRMEGTEQTANSVHPGVIITNLSRHMGGVVNWLFGLSDRVLLKTVAQGAATQVYVATHPSLDKVSGKYFADCNILKARKDTEDPEIAKKLWEVTEEIVKTLP